MFIRTQNPPLTLGCSVNGRLGAMLAAAVVASTFMMSGSLAQVAKGQADEKSVATAEQSPDKIRLGDRLYIHVAGTLPELPIEGLFQVERSGKVALGPIYGRLVVSGSTIEEAEQRIKDHLKQYLRDPAVMVTGYDPVIHGQGAAPREQALERRVKQLEEEVGKLKAKLAELGAE